MPLTERDPNISGRESRASNFSGKDARSLSITGKSPADVLSSGVLGMLKTTTESGDIGSLSFQPRRLPKISQAPLPRRPSHQKATSRPSSHYSRSASIRSKASNCSNKSVPEQPMPGSWPYSHFPNFDSQDFDQSQKESLPYTPRESTRSLALTSERPEPMERTQSITQNLHPNHGLHYHPSLTSLRSQGLPTRPRSPYAYPTRLRRPGYRPGSPALSENAVALRKRPNAWKQGPAAGVQLSEGYKQMGYRHGATRSTPLLRPPMPIDNTYPFEQGVASHAYGNLQPQVSRFNRLTPPSDFVPEDSHMRPVPVHMQPMGHMQPPYYMQPSEHMQMSEQLQPAAHIHSGQTQASDQMQPPAVQMYRSLDEYHFLSPVDTPISPADTTPYVGFVQRVKTVLEERISSEEVEHRSIPNSERFSFQEGIYQPPTNAISAQLPPAPQQESPSTSPIMASIAMGMIEKPQTPVVEVVANTPPSTPTVKRLTRAMIKEAIDTTSEADAIGSSPSCNASILQYDSGNSVNESPTKETSDSPPSNDKQGELPVHDPGHDENLQHEESDFDHDYKDESRISRIDSQIIEPFDETTTTSVMEFPVDMENFSARFSLPEDPASDMSRTVEVEAHVSSEPTTETMESYCIGTPLIHLLNDRPLSLPYIHEFGREDRTVGKHIPSHSVPTISPHYHFPSLDARLQPPSVHDENRPTEDDSGMATVFPQCDPEKENPPIVSTVVSPSSYSDPQRWATDSIIARRSYVPVLPDSGHTSISSIDERVNLHKSYQSAVSPTNTPGIASRRASVRLSANSDQDNSSSTAQENNLPVIESRLSGLRHFQFPLPDLTEDSQEDASTTNLRMLGARPPGFRSGGPRGMRFDGRQSNRVSMQPPPQPRSYLSKTGTNSSEMPVLNFSHSDLTARLNQALGLRSSRSLEEIKRSKRRGMVISLERSASSSSLKNRERYRSFFMPSENSENEDAMTGELTEENLAANKELLLEINRLSIPSVNNLTIRLSELLPKIKAGHSESNLIRSDETVQQTLDHIRDLGSPERMASLATSSGTPLKASRPSLSEPGLSIPSSNARYLMKDLPPLPRDRSDKRLSIVSSPSTLPIATAFVTRDNSIQKEAVELEAPAQNTSAQDGRPATPAKSAMAKKSLRSLKSATEGARAWNKEGTLPWSEQTKSMDAAMPTRDATGSPALRLLIKAKSSKSTINTAKVDHEAKAVRTMSPGLHGDAELVPTAEGPDLEKATPLKKGILGSLSRKIGMRPRIDKAGFPIDPVFLHPEERPVDPGDRYPTTGLTPPAGLNIEENRSFFSDDSSRSERVVSLRKRLVRRTYRPKTTNLRPFSPATVRSDAHRATSHWVTNGGSVFGTESNLALDVTQPDVVVLYEKTPAGMSRMEFRAKRLIERLRYFWFKSGEVFRTKHQRHPAYDASDMFPHA